MSYVPTVTTQKTPLYVTASTTLTAWNQRVMVDSTIGPVTITLATAIGNAGLEVSVIKSDASQNVVTVVGSGTQTINGVASPAGITLTAPREGVTIEADAAGNCFALDDVTQDLRSIIVAKTASYTATVSDDLIVCDATIPFTVTLPLASSVANSSRSKRISIKKGDTTVGAVTVAKTGTDTIEVINSSPMATAASTSFNTSGAIYTFVTNATATGWILGD